MSEEEKEAIDTLQNCIADYVIGDFCVGKYCPQEDTCKNDDCPFEKAIDTVVNLIEKQQKEIYCLKNKVHISKCSICGKEFEHKRSDCKFCKDCSKKEYNHNYFKNMSEDKKRKRREYSKLYMRRIRGYKKEDE